ncbi:CRISPR-associated protein, Csn1 family [uncultured Candidatus Thioglobus sp.]|nr:CRISPR-associated protein, Csn1 family [uncultured Candidatus Thioglobus sp.]
MSKRILRIDLGNNSIGWVLLEDINGEANSIIDIGSRIFTNLKQTYQSVTEDDALLALR